MLFGSRPSLWICHLLCFSLFIPWPKGRDKVYALCFHFLPTLSLVTLLSISLHLPSETTLLNGSFSFLILFGLCCIRNCVPSSWKWAFSSSRIHLRRQEAQHTWDSFFIARDLNFWIWTLQARSRGRSPNHFKNKNFPQKRKRLERLGEKKKCHQRPREFENTVYPLESLFF